MIGEMRRGSIEGGVFFGHSGCATEGSRRRG